ncbi:CDP-glycerol glycerophosphotransferase family protein [Enterococcus sp. JM9B]|uniref:CDP-glycerol glycerophosphotransferase family protein n=1 Tax=Enterococcus sp. JM9B TaxID=1857216 RepID=UPI001DFC8ED1|nr:CDP-glycerol glycerophosphotransferase family protein [Enterococcus sp. JM9B]KAF1304823.1 hypothetical protein BAU16_01225 [Enterococcus sp. JM9B]
MKQAYKKIKKVGTTFFPSKYTRLREYYAENYENRLIKDNLIVYETRDGSSIVDSPYAIFNYLISTPEYNNYEHIWIIESLDSDCVKIFPESIQKKIKFVERSSIEYVDALLEAKYLITNSTFESFFSKREGQVYINTWHGTPLKHMGFDIPGKVSHSQNVLRNFLMTDYLLSPNSHTTNIFSDSYKLKGIYPGEIIESGYPRIDLTMNSIKNDVFNKLELFGTVLNKKLPNLLYCPTWKGENVNDANDDLDQIVKEIGELKKSFNEEYNVLLKVHPFIYKIASEDERISDILVSDYIDANEILSVTDILITDYSSIFFDFLVTKKPIIFYVWDKDIYLENRGMYLENSDLPGPIVENIHELIDALKNINSYQKEYENAYQALSKRMIPYEDGNSTKRYVEYIFRGKSSSNLNVVKLESAKTKLLIFPGGMRNNGITTSFLNLIDNIDYDKYDVTIISNVDREKEISNNLNSMNKNVRPLFRFGGDILTRKEKIINKKLADKGVPKNNQKIYPEIAYRREMRRLTAGILFDVSIDFSGYSYFWGRHILSANARKYVAFMHNDLMADSQREINGVKPMARDLNGLFSIYFKFDKLVSVSPMTRDVNLKKLSNYVTAEQMSYVVNTINIEKILKSTSIDSEEKNKLITKKTSLMSENNEEIQIFKNLTEIAKGKFYLKTISSTDKIISYAEYQFEDKDFVKISINDEYYGWSDKKNFCRRPLEVLNVEDVHGFATVSCNLNYVVWKDLDYRHKDEAKVTYIKPFFKRYVEFSRIAYTNLGRYFYIKYNGKNIGWVSPKPLRRIHKLNKWSPLNTYFYRRIKELENEEPIKYSKKIKNLELYGILQNKEDITLWSDPENSTMAELLPISEDYLGNPYRIIEENWIDSQMNYKLVLPDYSTLGYTRQENVTLISKEEFQRLIQLNIMKETEVDQVPRMDLLNQAVPKFDEKYINIVTMGRLSPEKNQSQLIEAFARFRLKFPKSRLFILGKGPLANELKEKIIETKQEGFVFLLGHINTPFRFIEKTNLFVLPSFYEGQPMVLLEALTLGMRILASNIPANINVIGKNEEYGFLTKGTDVDAIYNGLVRSIEEKKSFNHFDYIEYNKGAINNFYKEISFEA